MGQMNPSLSLIHHLNQLPCTSPSSSGVTLMELLKGAHSQINYLDHQIQKLNDERVVFLRRLSKKDLKILTQDNMIKHLCCNLHGATDHIQSIKCQLKEMSYTPHEDECCKQYNSELEAQTASGNDVQSSLRLRELSELLDHTEKS